MSSDRFSYRADSPIAPSRHAFAVLPDDLTPLSPVPKALFVGGAGAVTLRTVDSAADVTFTVLAGQILPVRVEYVRASGTDAEDIVALA